MSKVLIATYYCSTEFRIPKGIDLEAEGVKYWVKWSTLYIELPDGTILEVAESYPPSESNDFKRPSKCEIEDDDDDD